jgi:hypothetical protein
LRATSCPDVTNAQAVSIGRHEREEIGATPGEDMTYTLLYA